jgi:hypothetical protein
MEADDEQVLLDQCRVTNLWFHGQPVLAAEFHAKDKVHYCAAGYHHLLVLVFWIFDCYYSVYEYICATGSSV